MAAVAEHREESAEAGVLYHGTGVSGNGYRKVLDEGVVHVQGPAVLVLRNTSVVADELTVILSRILDEVRKLHGPDGVGSVADVADPFLDLPVVDRHVGAGHHAVIVPSCLVQHAAEVLHVHAASQALAEEHGIVVYFVRHPSVCKNVAEVQLPAVLQDAPDLAEYLLLFVGEVDHAV